LNADPDEPTGVDQFSSLGKAKPTAERPTPTPRRFIGRSLLRTGVRREGQYPGDLSTYPAKVSPFATEAAAEVDCRPSA
jgi:hypothetical protein